MHESTHKPEQVDEIRPPSIVGNLRELADSGIRFSTVYADPPWRYDNSASRGAAENHYSTMTVRQICDEPVKEFVNENAHLHLWTTNAFLREAFEVMEAWGFQYKSCLVWVKPRLGMGNYWRVSHEYSSESAAHCASPTEPSPAGSSRVERDTAANPGVSVNSSNRSVPAPTSNSTDEKKSPTPHGPSTETRWNDDCFEALI